MKLEEVGRWMRVNDDAAYRKVGRHADRAEKETRRFATLT